MSLLEAKNVTLKFGGLTALSNFSFSLDAGELVGLIGPNGAGKTTAFNVATGVYAPTAGQILFEGRTITGKKPHQINQLGLARTFQNIRLFGGLPVMDNVMIGFNQSLSHGFLGTMLRTPKHLREDASREAEAMELLETFKLHDRHDRLARNLCYGDQRRLEIARALATNPKVLLLDEPAAGMNPREKEELMDLIRFVREHFHVGIWLIEHDMKLVMSICERITVLDHGETIAVGPPDEVKEDPKVIEAYLGTAV